MGCVRDILYTAGQSRDLNSCLCRWRCTEGAINTQSRGSLLCIEMTKNTSLKHELNHKNCYHKSGLRKTKKEHRSPKCLFILTGQYNAAHVCFFHYSWTCILHGTVQCIYIGELILPVRLLWSIMVFPPDAPPEEINGGNIKTASRWISLTVVFMHTIAFSIHTANKSISFIAKSRLRLHAKDGPFYKDLLPYRHDNGPPKQWLCFVTLSQIKPVRSVQRQQ